MLAGQPAVNTNSAQPGVFFADSTGASLFKVGPCAVGAAAPNTGATGDPGQLGNTLGELWLDTAAANGPLLKVWDGTQWRFCAGTVTGGGGGTTTIVADTPPDVTSYADGALWWDSETGLLYILYNDGSTRQWTQVSSSVVQ
jgi:hypothetical protein